MKTLFPLFVFGISITKTNGEYNVRKITLNQNAVILVVSMAFLFSAALFAADKTPSKPAVEVSYKRIPVDEYQNFINNWDETKSPVLCAFVQTMDQYNSLFSPAPIMKSEKLLAPEASLFSKESVLVVAWVMAGTDDMDKVFKVEKVVAGGGTLELHYRYTKPADSSSFTVKNYLALRIAKGAYKKVAFVENGKKVGELNTGKGEWVNVN